MQPSVLRVMLLLDLLVELLLAISLELMLMLLLELLVVGLARAHPYLRVGNPTTSSHGPT